jgi:hypothetical protein
VRVRRANALTCFAFASQVLEAHDGRCNARNLGRALQTRRFAGSNLLTELKKGSTLLSFLHRFPEKFIVTANDAEGTKDFTVELCRPDLGATGQRASTMDSSAVATAGTETEAGAGGDTDSEGGGADDDDSIIEGGAFNYGQPIRAVVYRQAPVRAADQTAKNGAKLEDGHMTGAAHDERSSPSDSSSTNVVRNYPPPLVGQPAMSYSSMRVTELRKVLRDLGLSPAGTKKELLERLEDRQRNELYDWSRKDC